MVYSRDMLNLNSIMIGSQEPNVLADFYRKVFEKKEDMSDGDWHGWMVGGCFFGIGKHSEVKDKAQEPARIIFNFETEQVKEEFERIKGLGAKVIKDPYEMQGMWIATLADPDNNYFQLMSPWKEEKK